MEKKFLPTLFSAFALGIGMYAQAQCSLQISGDTLVCAGDSPTLTALAIGPGNELTTTLSAGNNHRGNMFDIVATNSVNINSFEAHPMGNTTIEIYYKVGTWQGFANTPNSWTFIGSAQVTAQPYGTPTPIPVNVNVTIPAGQTYAFYVTSSNTGVSLNYTDGGSVGSPFASDANITFLQGGGMEYPFTNGTGAIFQPRVWNGKIHYSLANTAGTTVTWGGGENTLTLNPTITADQQFTASATIPGCAIVTPDTFDVAISVANIDAGSDTALCQGLPLTLAGSDGTNFSWNNGIQNNVPFVTGPTADYILSGLNVDGCPKTDTVTVSTAPVPTVTAGNDVDVCDGSAVTLNAQGATTYIWDNGVVNNQPFVPTSSGDYTVIGSTGTNCSDTDVVHVEILPIPTVIGSNDMSVCPGTQIALFAVGTPNISWNNGVQTGVVFTAAAGEYIATGTAENGCTDQDTVTVTVYDVHADVNINSNVLTATQTNATYQWVNCPAMTEINGATGASFTAEQEGSYAVIVTDNQHGCEVTSECIDIFFTDIEEQNTDNGLSVYPVPAENFVAIVSADASISRLQLIDMTGRVLADENVNAQQAQLDLSNYPVGQFFVRVYRNGSVETVKVIKK